MVSQIQLGSIFQENGKTVIGGSQSGFDVESLVNSLAAAKAQPATNLTTKNTALASQVTALGQLNNLLNTFQSAADQLRNPPGVNNAGQNSFSFRTASVSASTVNASTYLSVTAAPGTSVQQFTVNQIKQLATQSKQHTGVFTLADTTTASAVTSTDPDDPTQPPTAGLFQAGTFTLKNLSGGADASITLNQGDSLQSVANKFNAVTSKTGIQASILQIGTGQYELTFTGTSTGAANGFDFTTGAGTGNTVTDDTGGVLSNLSFTNTQSAQNADFFVDGIELSRSSNAVNDVIPGLTFNLLQTTPTGVTTPPSGTPDNTNPLTVSVQADTSTVTTAVQSFADAYNNLLLFISTQSQRNADGTPTADAVLATDPVLRTVSNTVNQEVTSLVHGLASGDPQSLADIGISFSNFAGDSTNPATDNIMSIDTDTLGAALSANFQGVANLFEFNMTSDNPLLTVFSRTNNLTASSFSVTKSGSAFTATVGSTTINLTAKQLPSGGYSLTAPDGSALDGLVLLYSSTADATMNVSITQGVADRIYNTVNGMTNTTDGLITNEVNTITSQETRNTKQIDTINDQVSSYKDQITQQFANLEAALTQANSLLALLTAQQNAQLSNSGN